MLNVINQKRPIKKKFQKRNKKSVYIFRTDLRLKLDEKQEYAKRSKNGIAVLVNFKGTLAHIIFDYDDMMIRVPIPKFTKNYNEKMLYFYFKARLERMHFSL